jgi:CspA family cold shock protein
MALGKVKKVIADKGFGFIEAQGGDLFFHHSEVKGVTIEELREGQQVEYTVGQGKKGPCATEIRVVS